MFSIIALSTKDQDFDFIIYSITLSCLKRRQGFMQLVNLIKYSEYMTNYTIRLLETTFQSIILLINTCKYIKVFPGKMKLKVSLGNKFCKQF